MASASLCRGLGVWGYAPIQRRVQGPQHSQLQDLAKGRKEPQTTKINYVYKKVKKKRKLKNKKQSVKRSGKRRKKNLAGVAR